MSGEGFPRTTAIPADTNATVQVLMTEGLARRFEQDVLARRDCKLAAPLLFSDDDVPTYIIQVPPATTNPIDEGDR